jgi:hypothetical protein
MEAIQLLDYAAGLKLDTIQLSSLSDYEPGPSICSRSKNTPRVSESPNRRGHGLHLWELLPTTKEGEPAAYLSAAGVARPWVHQYALFHGIAGRPARQPRAHMEIPSRYFAKCVPTWTST